VLTPGMQAEYMSTMTAGNWRAMLDGVGAAAALA
jgi:hypothetical protein